MEALYILSLILVISSIFSGVQSDPVEDKQALLDFIDNIPHSRSLNWIKTSSVCHNWTGVTCNQDNSRVVAVRLPGVGLDGQIPVNTLSRLPELQILSLRLNGIYGSFPSDLANLKNLSYLYLQFNNFTGPLPDLLVWKNLTSLNLSNNDFNGSIPNSLSNMSQLTALNLANNSFSGEIPEIFSPKLLQLDLSNNDLTGSVPKSLERFPVSSFVGNNVSFVHYPPPASLVTPNSSQSHPKSMNSGRLGETALLGIIVAGCVLGLVAFVFLLLVFCSKLRRANEFSSKLSKGGRSPDKAVSGSQDANNRLVFFPNCNYTFDLEDLLRASAEVLGKGTFGTVYKAILEDATTVVVKRLKEVSCGKRDFGQHMEVVGSIRHENVVALRAYYHSKEEKLMVYDYYGLGSVSAMLHGKRGEGRVPLDWDTRLKIAIGAARGIARIHAESNGKLVHGNIKSSNIFLNSQLYGCVSDLGLTFVMSPVPPTVARAAGYRAPEVAESRKLTQPSDVYSYGVLLLEILTGKSPVHTVGGDEVVHLVRWVHSVVREEWTAEVFDAELMRYPNIDEEMVEMLQIAMSCVTRLADQRPKMREVVKLVENIRLTTENRSSCETKSESSTPPPQPPSRPPLEAFGVESSTL